MIFRTVASMITATALIVLTMPNAAPGQSDSWASSASGYGEDEHNVGFGVAVDSNSAIRQVAATDGGIDQTLQQFDAAIQRLDEAVADLDQSEKVEAPAPCSAILSATL